MTPWDTDTLFSPSVKRSGGKQQIEAELQAPVHVPSKGGVFPLKTTPKSQRRGVLCSPAPLSLRFVPGKPERGALLAAGKAILQAVWPGLLASAGRLGFSPAPGSKNGL